MKRIDKVLTMHAELKAKARQWVDLEVWEREQIERTCSSWLMHDARMDTLWGKNSAGEWCRYS